MLSRNAACPVQVARQPLIENLIGQENFPEPDTPVMQVIIPSGMFTSMFFRLFSRAPLIVRNPVGFLRSSGTGILILPLKYAPVIDFGFFMISCAVPQATTSPPCEPAPGPISTI